MNFYPTNIENLFKLPQSVVKKHINPKYPFMSKFKSNTNVSKYSLMYLMSDNMRAYIVFNFISYHLKYNSKKESLEAATVVVKTEDLIKLVNKNELAPTLQYLIDNKYLYKVDCRNKKGTRKFIVNPEVANVFVLDQAKDFLENHYFNYFKIEFEVKDPVWANPMNMHLKGKTD